MAYTEAKLMAELKLIYRKGVDENWMWEQSKDRPSVPDSTHSKHIQAGGKVVFSTLLQYCWAAYNKAHNARGVQYIGRSFNLSSDLRKEKSNLNVDSSLLDDNTFGNILQMGKWANVVNDVWILGGINRVASFELHSPRSKSNLWSNEYNGFVVTGREITGLLRFGYKLVGRHNGKELYVPPADAKVARNADLEDYHLAIALKETLGGDNGGGIADMLDHAI